ncbi:MAG: hypothetical protein JSV04_12405 [Candidatus Heimdallarchaeota archaeon]|nr:MAG: hypothetical protein JSV04_12405 [Candidatus Heimdallarchaeota archaeon]
MSKLLDKLKGSKEVKLLYILSGAAAAIGLVSGIGATCTTFDPGWWKLINSDGGYTFGVIGENQLIYVLSYFVTWLVAIAWGVLYWALGTRKRWFYPVALITSILGFFSGFLPAFILFWEWYLSYGVNGMVFTPSWFRTIINLIIFIILILPMVRRGVNTHMEDVGVSTDESVGSQVTQFAYVLFGFGIVMMFQPFLMPMHIIDGVNIASSYGYLLASGTLQFIGGLTCILLGLVTRIAGHVLAVDRASDSTPTKA